MQWNVVIPYALVVILGIALLDEEEPRSVVPASGWIQDKGTVPLGPDNPDDPDDLQSYLIKEGVYSLLLFKEDGRFRWVYSDGAEIEICGAIDGGKITGCGIEGKKVELTTFTDFTVIGTKASDCVLGKYQGQTAWIHRNPPGHTYPCHH